MKNIKTICIYDFDSTLINSQLPDTGKDIWKDKTGQEYPHIGWWGRKESLSMDVFEHLPMRQIVIPYSEDLKIDNCLMVMLTGRLKKLSTEVEKILTANNFGFDKYMYNRGKKTIDDKIEQITKLLDEYPNVELVKIYEDRVEHIKIFDIFLQDMVDQGKINDYIITQITN